MEDRIALRLFLHVLNVVNALRGVVGSILTGILLALSMPPVGYSFLIWVAIVPLLYGVKGTRAPVGFLAGLGSSVVAALSLILGLAPIPHPFSGEQVTIYASYLLFGLLLCFVGAVVAGINELRFRQIPILAAYAVVLEAASMVALPVHIGIALYRQPSALFLASYLGIWAVSWFVWLTNLAVVKLIQNPKAAWMPCMALVGCLFLAAQMFAPRHALPKGGVPVGVIQTRSLEENRLAGLNKSAGSAGASLVVWPELSAIAIAAGGDTRKLRALSADPGQPAFVTSFQDSANPKSHNLAVLFSNGKELGHYFKRKPFGVEAAIHKAGDVPGYANWNVPVGLNICFDSTYPAIMRETALAAPVALLALPNEDPPSANGVVQALHAAYMPFRAAELGVGIARADITAYSMIVGPDGTILGELDIGEGILVRTVPPPRETFYKAHGDLFLYLCEIATAVWVLVGVWKFWRRKRAVSDKIRAYEGSGSGQV